MIDSLTARVLHGLELCGTDPETREDCKDCPYREGESCIARLAREARSLILQMDQFISVVERTKPAKPAIDTHSKPVRGLCYCVGHSECYGADHECPYHESEDCLQEMQRDLLALIEGGGAS